jgi:hypothetical protein
LALLARFGASPAHTDVEIVRSVIARLQNTARIGLPLFSKKIIVIVGDAFEKRK